jgi:hypothetical protein
MVVYVNKKRLKILAFVVFKLQKLEDEGFSYVAKMEFITDFLNGDRK